MYYYPYVSGSLNAQINFNLVITKDCQYATLTPASSTASASYTVNTNNDPNQFLMPDFTISDTYCAFSYGLKLFTTDSNSNSIRDDAEFSVVTQTAEAAGSYMFYKSASTDVNYYVNRLMPITNTEVGTYYVRGTAQVQDSGATSFSEIQFDILPNCNLETLTPPASNPDVAYTFHAAQVVSVLPETTSSNPTLCPVSHHLQVKDGSGNWVDYASSQIASVITYVEGTRTLTVFYDTDNEFSSQDTSNIYEIKLIADMNNQG